MFFTVEYHTGGTMIQRVEVRANTCRGLTPVPDFEALCEALPARLWPAIQRGGWWSDKYAPNMPMRCDLVDKRGKALGTLFACKAVTA